MRVEISPDPLVTSRITGSDQEPDCEPARAGDIRDSRADTTRARAELGFEARTYLEEGLATTWRWFLEKAKS